MKLIVALALALAPLRTDADGPPAKGGLRVFEGAPSDKKLAGLTTRPLGMRSKHIKIKNPKAPTTRSTAP